MVVRDRCVFSQVPLGPGDIIPSIVNSVPEVIVLSSPAPEGVGKAIDLLKLLHGQAAHPAEELLIWKNVHVLVQLRCYKLGKTRGKRLHLWGDNEATIHVWWRLSSVAALGGGSLLLLLSNSSPLLST